VVAAGGISRCALGSRSGGDARLLLLLLLLPVTS
jgi:hypothetical protein